jgi:hypothetical protein
MTTRAVAVRIAPIEAILYTLRPTRLWKHNVKLLNAHPLPFPIVLRCTAPTAIKRGCKLPELSACIAPERIKMAAVSQAECVRLPTADSDDLLIGESLHFNWARLVGLLIRVLRKVSDVI